MAVRPFTFENGLAPFTLPATFEWEDDEREEIYHFVLAFKCLEDRFIEKLGRVISFEHRNDSDDPPDIMVNFEGGQLGFEMTKLLTTNLGHFNKTLKKLGKSHLASILPNLSTLPTTERGHLNEDQALKNAFDFYSGVGWASVDEEFKLWFEAALHLYKKKIRKAERRQIDYVVLFNTEPLTPLKEIAELMQVVVSKHNATVPPLIIHHRIGMFEHDTWIIEKGVPLSYFSQHPERDPADLHLTFEEVVKKYLDKSE